MKKLIFQQQRVLAKMSASRRESEFPHTLRFFVCLFFPNLSCLLHLPWLPLKCTACPRCFDCRPFLCILYTGLQQLCSRNHCEEAAHAEEFRGKFEDYGEKWASQRHGEKMKEPSNLGWLQQWCCVGASGL